MNETLIPYKLSNRAEKQLKKMRKSDANLYKKIQEVIYEIRKDPELGSEKKGDLKGYKLVDIYHLGISYELCYCLEEDENGKLVLIIMMGTRENFYEELKRYLNL
jgi:Txe/YoeB family toxin of Txe-Axe toxin-antitoxin module